MLLNHWDGHFLYRGEESTEFVLRSRYGRLQVTNPENDKASEQAMLREFKRRASAMIQNPPNNDWEWLALAQHFGMSTRLLDWTENPLIAGYFATQRNNGTGAVIYILNEDEFDDVNEDISPFQTRGVKLYRPKHINPRISGQGAVFTVHSSPSKPFCAPGIERWIIDERCIVNLNIMLYTYGIHEATIFPDLGGVARLVNFQFEW